MSTWWVIGCGKKDQTRAMPHEPFGDPLCSEMSPEAWESMGRELRSAIETIVRLCKNPDHNGFQWTQMRSGGSHGRDASKSRLGGEKGSSRSEKARRERQMLDPGIQEKTWQCCRLTPRITPSFMSVTYIQRSSGSARINVEKATFTPFLHRVFVINSQRIKRRRIFK